MGGCFSKGQKKSADKYGVRDPVSNPSTGGEQSTQSYSRGGFSSISSPKGDDDGEFGTHGKPISVVNTGNVRESTKVLRDMKQWRDRNAERILRDPILTPRTMFKEIYDKKIENMAKNDARLLRRYMARRRRLWRIQDNAATKLQSLFRGQTARFYYFTMKAKREYDERLLKEGKEKHLSGELATKRREAHENYSYGIANLEKQKIDNSRDHRAKPQWIKADAPNFTSKFDQEKNLKYQYGEMALRRKAIEFWHRASVKSFFDTWKSFYRSKKMQNYVRFHFFHTQFSHWAKKSKRRRNARILFDRLQMHYDKNMKIAAMEVWWKRIRKTYRIFERDIKASRYRVIVENTGILFPKETSKSLISVVSTDKLNASLNSTLEIRPHRKTNDREKKLKELDEKIKELREWERIQKKSEAIINLDYMAYHNPDAAIFDRRHDRRRDKRYE